MKKLLIYALTVNLALSMNYAQAYASNEGDRDKVSQIQTMTPRNDYFNIQSETFPKSIPFRGTDSDPRLEDILVPEEECIPKQRTKEDVYHIYKIIFNWSLQEQEKLAYNSKIVKEIK